MYPFSLRPQLRIILIFLLDSFEKLHFKLELAKYSIQSILCFLSLILALQHLVEAAGGVIIHVCFIEVELCISSILLLGFVALLLLLVMRSEVLRES